MTKHDAVGDFRLQCAGDRELVSCTLPCLELLLSTFHRAVAKGEVQGGPGHEDTGMAAKAGARLMISISCLA